MAKAKEYEIVLEGEKAKKRGRERASDVIKFARRFDRYTRLEESDVSDISEKLEEGEVVKYAGMTNVWATGEDKKTQSYSATSVVLTNRRFFFVCSPYSDGDGPYILDIEKIYESVPLDKITYCDIEDVGSERPGGKTYLKLRACGKVYRIEMLCNFISNSKNIKERENILKVFVKALEAANDKKNTAVEKEDGQKGFAAAAE